MTLGRPSLSILSLLLFNGCAYGDVTGTRGTDPPSRDDSEPAPAGGSASSTSGTSDSSEPAPGPIDYDALFDAPADPTTTDGLVTGLWAGKTYYGESRLKLTANKVVIAMKCGTSPAEGMEVGAIVTANQMKILATKNNAGSTYGCGIKVSPVVIPRCSDASAYDCFDIDGTTLYFTGKPLFTTDGSSSQSGYTKLSDD